MPLVTGTWVNLSRRGWLGCLPITTLCVFQFQITFFIWHKICNFPGSTVTLPCLTPPHLYIFQTLVSPCPCGRHFTWPHSLFTKVLPNIIYNRPPPTLIFVIIISSPFKTHQSLPPPVTSPISPNISSQPTVFTIMYLGSGFYTGN